jgi:hypothetical protein
MRPLPGVPDVVCESTDTGDVDIPFLGLVEGHKHIPNPLQDTQTFTQVQATWMHKTLLLLDFIIGVEQQVLH